jgi:colanic acid biosynthesis protein WcaH
MAQHATGWVDEAAFTAACAALPLVSIDWVIYTPAGKMLLGLRNNAPARGYWFTPGGRIRKDELHRIAMQRIAADELGLSPANIAHAFAMGVWDHFYPDSAFASAVSTHYVNLPYALQVDAEFEPCGDAQHAQWRWVDVAQAQEDLSIHHHARSYVQWVDQQRRQHGQER